MKTSNITFTFSYELNSMKEIAVSCPAMAFSLIFWHTPPLPKHDATAAQTDIISPSWEVIVAPCSVKSLCILTFNGFSLSSTIDRLVQAASSLSAQRTKFHLFSRNLSLRFRLPKCLLQIFYPSDWYVNASTAKEVLVKILTDYRNDFPL